MAEASLDVRDLPRPQAYRALEEHLRAVLEGIDDPIAAMATFSAARIKRAKPVFRRIAAI
jgi:L-methionine (R)-S-oxide reductase